MSQPVRVAVHTAVWVAEWGENLVPHLELAAKLGYDGAEISLLGLEETTAATLKRVASDLGIALLCTTGLGPDTDVTSEDPSVRAAGIDYLRRAADIVASSGSDLLTGVIYGPWGLGPAGARAERQLRSAEVLASVAPTFAERGITLGIEALNRFETDLVNTAAEAVEFTSRIDAPNVGVLLDTFHMNIEERSLADALQIAGARLVHVQLADNDRGAPGTGHIDWDEVFDNLMLLAYDRWVSLEMFLQAGLPVSADLRIWRPIAPDPTGAAADGLEFVRRELAKRSIRSDSSGSTSQASPDS